MGRNKTIRGGVPVTVPRCKYSRPRSISYLTNERPLFLPRARDPKAAAHRRLIITFDRLAYSNPKGNGLGWESGTLYNKGWKLAQGGA